MVERGSLQLLRAFSTPKTNDAVNEDRWRVSEDGTTWAISDGASVSYDSGPWAELLVDRFIEQPLIDGQWLSDAVVRYGADYDRESMEWMQQAAFDRGSFATLLGGIAPAGDRPARFFAVGDSICAVLDRREVVLTFPYVRADEFDHPPKLFSTNPLENRQFDEKALAECWLEVDLSQWSAPQFMLMTDALGRWLLDEPNGDRVSALLKVSTDLAFADLVSRERSAGRLRRDDTTLMVIGSGDDVPADY